MDKVLQDIRYGLRVLRKQPGFTAVAIIALALGIGATTAIFSVVNGVLLRPLPYTDPDRLVMVWERNIPRNRATNVVSPANYLDWTRQTQTLDPMAALTTNSQRNLTGQGEPRVLDAQIVTVSFFNVLGVQALRGRTFTEEEGRPGNELVVILSHRLWQQLFGGRDEILSQSVTLNGRSYTVVGVMPADFYFHEPGDGNMAPVGLRPRR